MGDFRKLEVWERAYRLTLNIYEFTQKLPENEKFGLVSQLRRAAVSVASNIAEGEARFTNKDKVHFLITARGSVAEIQTQLLIASKLFSLEKEASKLNTEYDILGRKLTNLIKHRKDKIPLTNLPTNQ